MIIYVIQILLQKNVRNIQESEYNNLCIKCKNNYYPKLNDKKNKNNFIECYKNNSLEKYYLDDYDLFLNHVIKVVKLVIKMVQKKIIIVKLVI